MNTVRLILGDSLVKLKDLSPNSVDAVVSDPPYELGFMGKGWDSTGIAYSPELWGECFRILKPNGVIKAFSGTRTFHRMTQALKKSGFVGFEVHAWTYGSGFPKSMDVSKAIDKAAGAEREVVGVSANDRPKSQVKGGKAFDRAMDQGQEHQPINITAPATDAARQWSGYGTALKPAWEPIIVARKPI